MGTVVHDTQSMTEHSYEQYEMPSYEPNPAPQPGEPQIIVPSDYEPDEEVFVYDSIREEELEVRVRQYGSPAETIRSAFSPMYDDVDEPRCLRAHTSWLEIGSDQFSTVQDLMPDANGYNSSELNSALENVEGQAALGREGSNAIYFTGVNPVELKHALYDVQDNAMSAFSPIPDELGIMTRTETYPAGYVGRDLVTDSSTEPGEVLIRAWWD